MSRAAYWIIGGIVAVLMVAGLIAFSEGKETEDAQQKAHGALGAPRASGRDGA